MKGTKVIRSRRHGGVVASKGFKTASDLATACVEHGVHRVWADRISDMADHAMCMRGRPGGDREDSALRLIRVDADWPEPGCVIRMVRVEDSRRMQFVLKNEKFQIETVG